MPEANAVPAEQQAQNAAPENASGETAPESAAGENETQTQEGEQRNHKGGFQRRIDKLTLAKSKAEQEAEFWRTEALRNRQSEQQKTPQQQENKPAADGKPNPDNYETQAEYLEALTDWKVEARDKAREAKAQETEAKTKQETQLQQFKSREDGFREATADYDAVINQAIADDTPMSPALWSEIQDHEHGPALLYYLAQNPDEAERLAGMNATQVAREVGRLESRFVPSADGGQQQQQQQRQAAPVSKAPKPPSMVGKQSTQTSEKDPDQMSPEEWRQYRAKQFPNLR